MRSEQLDALFPATPEGFSSAMHNAVERLDERAVPKRRPVRLSLVAALTFALLLGTLAYAATTQWGLLELLKDYRPTEAAKDIVQTDPNAPAAMVEDIKFEVTEAAYDGEQIFLAVKMSVPEGETLDPERDPRVLELTLDGAEDIEWQRNEVEIEGSEGHMLVTIPCPANGSETAKVALQLAVFDPAARTTARGELIYDVPLNPAPLAVREITAPITMNGVTVTQLKCSYSPLKMYVDMRYHVDPSLDRFEQLRRQGMWFELQHKGEQLDSRGGHSTTDEQTGDTIIREELVTADRAYDELTVILTGEDREVYWAHTIQFEEANEG